MMRFNEIAAALESGKLSLADAAALVRAAGAKAGGRPKKTAEHAEIFAWFTVATGELGFKKTQAKNKLVDRYGLSEVSAVHRILKGASKKQRLVMSARACDEPENLLCMVADGLRLTMKPGLLGYPKYVLCPQRPLRLGEDFFFFIFTPEDFR